MFGLSSVKFVYLYVASPQSALCVFKAIKLNVPIRPAFGDPVTCYTYVYYNIQLAIIHTTA